jgi:NAD(P)-dependent dehydrogenase (short-subunit alcohol dehydrogenase family)
MDRPLASLAGKTVAIVGGASGIGFAVATAADAAGARVVLMGRHPERLNEAAQKIDTDTLVRVVDARRPDMLADVMAGLGQIDHLVTTTSVSATRLNVNQPIASVVPAAAQEFFAGKFWSQYWTAQAALPFLSRGGSIVFTSGAAARKSLPNHTVVAANNAAIEAMARQLAREAAPIRVNVVSPGLTATRAYDHLSPDDREQFFQHVTGRLPIPRVAQPDEIAQAYIFALTATYMTGMIIDMDGGLLVS